MWPFRKKLKPPLTSQAIAYLKVAVSPDAPSPAIELSHDDSPVLTDIGNDLMIAYVVDSGNSFTYIQHRDLSAAGVTEAQLRETGIKNLAAVADRGNLRVVPHPTNEMYAVLLDGNFEASMILLDSLWESSFRQFVQGDYLATIPTRDVLAFCDSRSTIGRQELVGILDKMKGSNDHPLLQKLLVRRSGKWMPVDAV